MRIYRCININDDKLLGDRDAVTRWDDAIRIGNEKSNQRCHNLFTNNCHHHVAMIMNEFRLDSKNNYNQVDVAVKAILKGKYISYVVCCFHSIY